MRSLIQYEPGRTTDVYYGEAYFITEDENIITMAKLMADEIYTGEPLHPQMRYPAFDEYDCDDMILIDSFDQVKSLAEQANEELCVVDLEEETA